MSRATVKTNIVFDYLSNSKKRITIMQGGTRSGKTYNIILFFVIKLMQESGKTLTICRASLPSIRGSVMRDFIEILGKLNLYSEDYHNKTENTYLLNGNLVEFVSVDQPQKIRGRKRNYLFINEANELNYEAWMQLVFRTEEKIVIDYNPSDEYHWIYDKVITRDDSDFFVTTYKDNPFLDKGIIDEIERLKEADENYWKIYGLGERGVSQETIYNHYNIIDYMPECDDFIYGLDFGYNNPSALVKIGIKEDKMYAEEIMYESKLTTNDLIYLVETFGLGSCEVYCDAAEPKTIEELSRAGLNVKPGIKAVKEGISMIKSKPLFITKGSTNLIKEIRNYKWKTDKDGKALDEPVKFQDHLLDAMRYAVYTHFTQPQIEFTWA
ncbi:MAG TPA: PBSX family phage terminase large subunit [Segetibacter sp.]